MEATCHHYSVREKKTTLTHTLAILDSDLQDKQELLSSRFVALQKPLLKVFPFLDRSSTPSTVPLIVPNALVASRECIRRKEWTSAGTAAQCCSTEVVTTMRQVGNVHLWLNNVQPEFALVRSFLFGACVCVIWSTKSKVLRSWFAENRDSNGEGSERKSW